MSDPVSPRVPESENRDARLNGDTAGAVLREARKTAAQNQARQTRKQNHVRKTSTELSAISIISKILVLMSVLLSFFEMVRLMGQDFGDFHVDFEMKLSEFERDVVEAMNAMQVQVKALGRKIEDGISSLRQEIDEKLEKESDVDLKLRDLNVRNDAWQKFMDKSFVTRKEVSEFVGNEMSMDDIMDYARQIVKKEIERHAADGLGMVDYAVTSLGGRVLSHSEQYGSGIGQPNGAERMLEPSFGEAGRCFPLKGGSGYVEIRLVTAIVPEAVTLEHVYKSVAFDRSDAPKQCRVHGWLQDDPDKISLMTEFSYDLDKSNAQTFKVDPAASDLVDTIRLDFTSNHGSASHTCIYRLRVHGHEPPTRNAILIRSIIPNRRSTGYESSSLACVKTLYRLLNFVFI